MRHDDWYIVTIIRIYILKFTEYGPSDGNLVIYFHGSPGSIEECSVFETHAEKNKLRIVCYDRFSIDASLKEKDYYQTIANAIKTEANGHTFDIIGFSIGCHVAIKISLLLGDQIKSMHLVSSAAPLESGNYLNDMAGGTVFKLAMNYPIIFSALSYWQSFLAKVSPKLIYSILFNSAKGKDSKLSKDSDFIEYIKPILTNAYALQLKGYLRDITQYIKPWQSDLALCSSRVYLWHGTDDNWSPMSMAELLEKELRNASPINEQEGASHYSCLFESAPLICSRLKNSKHSATHPS